MTAAPSCPHPHFAALELWFFFARPALFAVAGMLVFAGARHWFKTRSLIGVIIVASGALMVAAGFAGVLDGALLTRQQFGSHDWARLQRELQSREAALVRHGRDRPGSPNSQNVEGFGHQRPNVFYFSDPSVPPISFKVSTWRGATPRIVVSFGCDNNVVFHSATMAIEQLD